MLTKFVSRMVLKYITNSYRSYPLGQHLTFLVRTDFFKIFLIVSIGFYLKKQIRG